MHLNKKLMLLGILGMLGSIALLLWPMPEFVKCTPFLYGYSSVGENILIGLFSSCILLTGTAYFTFLNAERELHTTFYVSMVQVFNVVTGIRKKVNFHLVGKVSRLTPSDRSFWSEIFDLSNQLQEIDYLLVSKEIFTLEKSKREKDKIIFKFYNSTFKQLIGEVFIFAENLEKLHDDTNKKINIDRELTEDEIKEIVKEYQEGYISVCEDFYNQTQPRLKELDNKINMVKELNLKI